MKVLPFELVAEVSGGKDVPGLGNPGGVGGPPAPKPATGGGNLAGFLLGLAVNAVWDAAKGVWETRTTGNEPPEPQRSPEENNSNPASFNYRGDLPYYQYEEYDPYAP